MDYEKLKKECDKIFTDYAQNYDLSQKDIKRKFIHSFDVANNCQLICSDIFDTQEEIYIGYVIGLLHDISRFEQWKTYYSYKDTPLFSHPEKSAQFLFDNNLIKDYPVDPKYYNIIKFAIREHDSLSIDLSSSPSDLMIKYAKVVRDADKLEIFRQSTKSLQPAFSNEYTEKEISPNVLKCIQEHKCVSKSDCKSVIDRAVLQLAMAYDLNFNISKKIYIDNKYYFASYQNYKDFLSSSEANLLLTLSNQLKDYFLKSIEHDL